MNQEEINKQIFERLEKLEKKVLVSEKQNFKFLKEKDKTVTNFSGPKGGIIMLKKDGFLKNKKSVNDIKLELEKNNYFYKREVIQTALNRLSDSNGPLVSIKEKGIKVYVERK